jgi:tripartite-type tricarboxylate transporter receptor subunit TctC
MMDKKLGVVVTALWLAANAVWPTQADAQSQGWPTRPVKVIMATAAGSAPDVTARIVTDRLSQLWGQQVLILNRPGAGGLIAMQAMATAERDNHTLYFPSSSSLVVLPETNANAPLDIDRDLIPIGILGESPFMIVAGLHVGVNTLAELIALAKGKPGEVTYAGNFRGSLPNMTGEMLASQAGIKLTFVPYPGSAASMKDMLGERISLMIEGIAAFIGPLQANQVKALAVSSSARLPDRPDLPTVAETLPGFQSRGWTAVLAPTGTPEDVVRKVSADLRTVLNIPEVRSRLEGGATYVRHMTPAETRDFIRAERQAWRPVVKQFGVATQ